jgi:hypothetical protein
MSEFTLPPIIYGIETEYTGTIGFRYDDTSELVGACHGPKQQREVPLVSNSSFENIDDGAYVTALEEQGITRSERNEMLSNGGRFYIDHSGAEYCTPETTSAEEVVHRTFDGDRLVLGVLASLREEGHIISSQLNRKSVDHSGSSRGIHHNHAITYIPDCDTYWKRNDVVDAHVSIEISKAVIAGAGGLLVDSEDGTTKYYHSPRLAISNRLFGDDPIGQRGLLRYGLSPDVGCSRYESICNDALNSPWALRASLVLVNATTRLVAADMHHNIPKIVRPMLAARSVGQYGNNCHILVNNGQDEYQKPADVLEEIAMQLISAHDTHDILDQEMRQVLEEVIEVVHMQKSDPTTVAPVVEAVQRKLFIDKILGEAVDYDSVASCRRDFLWDMIGDGAAQRLREDKKIGWLGFSKPFSVVDRKKRLVNPPKDTRARIRANILTNPDKQSEYAVTNWSTIVHAGRVYELAPLSTHVKDAILVPIVTPKDE